jgi:nucleoside-diphosphate-sugar epimerase
MKVLILWATGSIGVAVAAEMAAHGHELIALARSASAAEALKAKGYEILHGDLLRPTEWADAIRTVEAVIHVAATFDDDMEVVDRNLITTLIAAAGSTERPIRFVHTGGCWLYGATGDQVATEAMPFDPIPAFEWAIETANMLVASAAFCTAIIHPAMVYHKGGGVLSGFMEDAKAGRPVALWGPTKTRWPLIHRDDLAVAYRLLAEQTDLTGHFNAVSEVSVPIGDIAEAIGAAMDLPLEFKNRDIDASISELGSWAEGMFLDQQMDCPRLIAEAGWSAKITDYRASDVFES